MPGSNSSNVDSAEVPQPIPFWSTLLGYARPYRSKLVFAMVTSFFVGIGVASQPLMIKFIVDQGVTRPNASPATRLTYAMFYAAVYLAMGYMRVGIWRMGFVRFISALESMFFDIRSRFFRHVQGLCFRFHDQISSGELFNYIMGSPSGSIKAFLQQCVMNVPHQAVSWVLAVCTLAYFDWLMTLILLVMIGLIVFMNRRSHRVLRTLSTQFMKTESSVSKYVSDILRGTREIKIHAIEDKVSQSFEVQIDRMREQSAAMTLRQNLEYLKPELVLYSGNAVMYVAGAYSCVYRSLTVGEFFAFISSVNLLVGPLMTLLQLNLAKANAEAGMERILRIMQTETTITERLPSDCVAFDSQAAKARAMGLPFLEFRGVTFGYGATPILKNVSCRIPLGGSVALVGPSGSGKSTFVRLVLRLYDPGEGMILLNGEDVRAYRVQDIRSRFGVVTQDPFLFQASIFENIRVAEPTASAAQVRHAMDTAYVSEFVDALPDKENTQVGENAFTLSGGQKQRVAIARAVLGNDQYYIFDEATSALDNQSEKRIQQAMETLRKDHTTIVIAHRLSTVRHADKILVFDKGIIVQEGTYGELAAIPGLFSDLLQHGM